MVVLSDALMEFNVSLQFDENFCYLLISGSRCLSCTNRVFQWDFSGTTAPWPAALGFGQHPLPPRWGSDARKPPAMSL
ncbi:hypothetical protein NL676_009276 [Syzygium grande]|nr:hypothetical protein NL676_009276 [Syzygium grande]